MRNGSRSFLAFLRKKDIALSAKRYLIDAMDWRAECGGLHRKEIPEVPVDALREAVINAFAHRQIESGQSIQIMVYRNRIEIYSPGAFPERITPEEFAENPPRVIFVDCENHVTRATRYEKHGLLEDMPEEDDGADGVEE